MGIQKDHFKNVFTKLNVKKSHGGASLSINLERLGHKIDIAQDALDAQVWNDIQLYMPGNDSSQIRTMTNSLNMETRGEVYIYPSTSQLAYGHYLYEGTLYVDPETGSTYARKGVTKVPAEPYTPLFYSNCSAEAHWDEVAYRNHRKQWIRVAKRSVR